jgi:hypothetical protein
MAEAAGDQRAPTPVVVTQLLKVRVADVDAAFARARDAGARVVQEPITHEYGERTCVLDDIASHRAPAWREPRPAARIEVESASFGVKPVGRETPWTMQDPGATRRGSRQSPSAPTPSLTTVRAVARFPNPVARGATPVSALLAGEVGIAPRLR